MLLMSHVKVYQKIKKRPSPKQMACIFYLAQYGRSLKLSELGIAVLFQFSICRIEPITTMETYFIDRNSN